MFWNALFHPASLPTNVLTDLHGAMVYLELAFAVLTALILVFVSAPYGRHTRAGWGPELPARLGWILMEAPASLYMLWVFSQGDHAWDLVPLVFLGLWQVHYMHRTFIFPFRIRAEGKRMPWLIVLLAVVFNTLNAWVNAVWIGHLGVYDTSWLTTLPMVLGTGVFLTGMGINLWADTVLIRLRGDGTKGYQIPSGFLYDHITSPNYFGEIVEWTGWAIATWSFSGLAFPLYTTANLAPRAFTNRQWYREKFPDYPEGRKALVPFLF